MKALRLRTLLFLTLYAGLLSVGAHGSHAQTTEPPGTPDSGAASWDGTYRRIRVPILSYRYISDAPDGSDAERNHLSVSPDMFRQHIDTLFYQGYTPITLDDLDRALETGERLPAEPVILTFDGGTVDAYQQAFPVLQSRHFTATFFVITGAIDAQDPAYVSWDQIREMAAAGMHIGSNTKTHQDLRGRAYDFLVYELLGSAQSIEAYTGVPARMFAYPDGHYDTGVLDVLRSMQMVRAVTLQDGVHHTTDNRYEVARRVVTHDVDVNGLVALLAQNP